jgi:hypothetical protein
MKRFLCILLVLQLIVLLTVAQAPGLLNYQGVARNSVGNVLASKTMKVRLTIRDGSAVGAIVYTETRTVTTNAFGLFTVQVGSGGATNVTGTVAGVNWSTGAKFMQVEIDTENNNNFLNVGATQLVSVPYAQFSAGGLPVGPAGGDLTGTYPNPTIAANAVTTAKIASNAVTTAKITDANVTTGKLADGAVTTIKITDASITQAKIAAGVTLPPSGAAGGDLGGNYPNPSVLKLRGTGIDAAAPVANQVLQFNGVNWAPANNIAGGLVLPFSATENNAATLFSINNNGDGTSLEGVNNTTTSSISAVRGIVSSTSPGGFASAVRGINNGTGGLGIGVWGSQAGSGWGVYGATPDGIGVYGNSSSGGYGLFGNSNNGTGVFGTSTNGIPGAFSVTNNANLNPALMVSTLGDGVAIDATSSSATSSISVVRGTVSSTSPGGFSSAVRGINSGTGGLGIGVWGSQGGSGWGIYGVTPGGIGVYGNSSGAGYGVFANSNSGTGLFATSTNGSAANISISNNANNNNVLDASTLGNGTVINVSSSGSGIGVLSSTGTGFAVHGITSAQSSAGIIGDNNGAGEAVVGRNTSDIAGAVVGRNDGGGYGVHGFIGTNTSNTAIGVYGRVGVNGSTGRAGRFENFNQTNTEANALEVETNGNGNIPDNTLGNAASFRVGNTNSVAAAVRGEVNTIFGNFGAAGIFGTASGTGGFAGLFHASNPAGNARGLVAIADGNGNAITANAAKVGNAVEANIDGNGTAVYGWVPTFATGRAARFQNFNDDNDNEVVLAKTIGNGAAGSFTVDNVLGTSPGVMGEVNSQFSNFGTAGVYGRSSGTGGFAGLFYSSNPAGNGPAVIAIAEGNGNGVTANADNLGDGVETTANGTGSALYAWTPNFGVGRAGRFANFNDANASNTVQISSNGTGNTLLINHTGASGNIAVYQDGGSNVARINKAGKGFFNGGTQASGADIAEAFDVTGTTAQYEPGDVLVIATDKDRAVEKSAGAYSTLVAGVYATKPGVLLTEENIDSNLAGKVPMGVVGVLPTKVCMEGGAIKRGDLIVTSSLSGVAMKADPDKVKIGQVIGKALQDYNGNGVGKINILVSIK